MQVALLAVDDMGEALLLRADNDPATVDEYADNPDFPSLNEDYGADAERNIKYRRDYWRRNRDLTIQLHRGNRGSPLWRCRDL